MKQKTPLELLTESNAELLAKRKKKRDPKPVEPSATAEMEYRRYMQGLIKAMTEDVNERLMPMIKQQKPNYIADDGWASSIADVFTWMRQRWASDMFLTRVRSDIARPLSMAESETTDKFMKSINKSVGVDFQGMISEEGMEDLMISTIQSNVTLVTGMTDDYLKSIEQSVYNGMNQGMYPTAIAKDIQKATGVNYRRAKTIARNEVAKVNTEVSNQRSKNLGVKYFRWSTSSDRRVSGNPSGEYPNAKIKCYQIAKRDIGYGEGVYRLDEGAEYGGETKLYPGTAHINCRCVKISLIEGVNFELP